MKHAFSLASKLAAMDVGDVIFLPDDAPAYGPTRMERGVHHRAAMSPKLTGRKFSTTRCDTITTHRSHLHTLMIERIA